ncbi:MAG: flagellar protein [Schwartzia sp.]|nr:flagellar protein [Schwartzia sp. (in: firmicutes)]
MTDSRIYWSSQPILPIGKQSDNQNLKTQRASSGENFADALSEAEKKVSFSQHALKRLEDRQLDFSEQDLLKLDSTVEKMAEKGARESLIYMNDVALIVSVPNRTVITAMDGESTKENIFTNIDSAAIL